MQEKTEGQDQLNPAKGEDLFGSAEGEISQLRKLIDVIEEKDQFGSAENEISKLQGLVDGAETIADLTKINDGVQSAITAIDGLITRQQKLSSELEAAREKIYQKIKNS